MKYNFLERKPDKSKNSTKVNEVIQSYTDNDNSMKFDPLGMYTGRPLDADTYTALTKGYKIYIRPEQDADDL